MLHLRCERGAFELPHGFGNTRRRWASRQSILLRLTTADAGVEGLGEASPLPGFSPDAIDDVASALERLGNSPSLALEGGLLAESDASAELQQLPESARFAVEVAGADLWCQQRGWTLDRYFARLFAVSDDSPRLPTSLRAAEGSEETALVPPAALIDVLDEQALARALDLSTAGVGVFKVKVGSDVERETRTLQRWRQRFEAEGRPLRLRLDANQALTASDLPGVFETWRALPIDYVEEPCSPKELARLDVGALVLPLAFDESLALGDAHVLPWLEAGKVRALVYKPMLLGGLAPLQRWHAQARRWGVELVISHLFDGPVAYRVYGALARVLAPGTAAGLGVHPGLDIWARNLTPNPSSCGVGLRFRRASKPEGA